MFKSRCVRGIVLMVLTLILCPVASRALPAKPPIRIEGGDPSVDGSFLRPYENRWRFSIQLPGKPATDAGVWSDRMEEISAGDKSALRRTQVARYKKGVRITFVTTFEKKTMAPLSFEYSRSDTGETRHIEFRGRTAAFRRAAGTGDGPVQDYVASLDHNVLDFYDGTYGILLDALPLREGFDAEIPAFDSDRACVDWIRVRVSGRERIAAGEGKSADTWVVQVETKEYGRSTWWLTREPPYVIRAEMTTSSDESAAKIVWTMI
jgi:Protein of unknown function (DUF3108)